MSVLRWLSWAAAAVLLAHLVARGLLASAIAHAPNGALAALPALDAPPARLSRYGTSETLRIDVGSPRAALSAWVLEPPDGRRPRGSVVVLHGVRLDKRSMLPTATALADAGFRSILVDLRGHGRSSGEYLTYGVVESRDVSQLLDALEARGMVLGPVGVHGYSYGGAVAIHLAARDARIAATVAVSAFSSVRGVVRDYLVRYAPELAPAVSETWLDAAVDLGGQMAEFDPDAAAPARVAPRSKSKILLVHGTLDDQVPAYHADAIERSAPGRVKKLLLPGETHASVLADGAHVVRDAACRWFEKELVRVGARGTRRI